MEENPGKPFVKAALDKITLTNTCNTSTANLRSVLAYVRRNPNNLECKEAVAADEDAENSVGCHFGLWALKRLEFTKVDRVSFIEQFNVQNRLRLLTLREAKRIACSGKIEMELDEAPVKVKAVTIPFPRRHGMA